jgi:hypothetical protein
MAAEKKTKEKVVEAKDKPTVEKAKVEAKTEVPAKTDAPKNYSRGEGQKVVTQAYKDNWDAIYKKKKR